MTATAIVTGAAGQDGYYLVERLLGEGMEAHATVGDQSLTEHLRGLPDTARLTVHELESGIVRIIRQIAVRAEISGRPAEGDVGSNNRDFALANLPLDWDRTSPDPADWSASLRATGAVAVVVDPGLIRPSDPAAIRADPTRARQELGWEPQLGLDRFLQVTWRLAERATPARA